MSSDYRWAMRACLKRVRRPVDTQTWQAHERHPVLGGPRVSSTATQGQIRLGLSAKGADGCLKRLTERGCLRDGRSEFWRTVRIPKFSALAGREEGH